MVASLMDISPEAPLPAGEGWRLVRASLLGASGENCAVLPFAAADGVARGHILSLAEPAVLPQGPCVCAIGAFDGLHLGHRQLLARARSEADALGASLVAVTFSPDPADVLAGPQASSCLLPCEARERALLALGADAVLSYDFTRELAALSYDEFVRKALCALLDLRLIVVGSDFRLGAGGRGTVEALSALGHADGLGVLGLDLLGSDGAPVTATRIRGLVRAGRVEAAAGLLGRAHCVAGRIEHGRGEGTSFGFPTANVMVDGSVCVPDQGVYAGFVTLGPAGSPRGAWPAAINVGLPPTFAAGEGSQAGGASRQTLLEANLIGFEGDAYGMEAHVTFVRWLRDSRPFSSVEELEATVLGNIDWSARAFGTRDVSREGAGA